MGQDEPALLRLWREKRGEVEPKDLSGNLIVQLGVVTESLNRNWFERNTQQTLRDVQCRIRHPVIRWMGATLDGVVAETGAVFEAKFMLPWSFSEEGAVEKHMAQLQHNMWVVDMSQSNSWAEFAGTFLRTRAAYAEHERAKAELKALVPEDAREASGHGIRARRSKAGAISFDVLEPEVAHAPVQ